MTSAKAVTDIVLAKAVRVVMLSIAAPELMLRAKDWPHHHSLPMHAFVSATIFYYIMSFPLIRLAERFEVRMGVGR